MIARKMNCGIHREDIIEILAENGVLSDKILEELKYDSYDGVRDLGRRVKSKRKSLR